ncbi:MAG: hypothetical protein ACW99U_19235 [Candidatus Thorarchaeota archaeon]|jgi:hypothetical protein
MKVELIKMQPIGDDSDTSFGRLVFCQERTDDDAPIRKSFDFNDLTDAGVHPVRYGFACADWQTIYIDPETHECWTEESMT